MGGKIDAYLDCTSPYSYIAITYLRKQRALLKQYDVEVEFHPVFLGGINVGSGNKPPWTLPAKAHMSPYDLSRAITHYNLPPLSSPSFFPILSITPLRALLVIKSRHPSELFEQVFLSTWIYSFVKHIDISQPANLKQLLTEHFPNDPKEVETIMEMMKLQEFKDKLTSNTKKVLDQGAYGAPWFWLKNKENKKEEPVFGSDRWAYMWRFLGVEFEDLRIVDREAEEGEEGKRRGAKL